MSDTPVSGSSWRYVAPLRTAAIRRTARWNTGMVVAVALLAAIGIVGVGLLVATDFGSWFTIALVCVFVLLCVAQLPASRTRGRQRRIVAGTGGNPTLTVDANGVTVPGVGLIRWHEMSFVCVTDARERAARQLRVPLFGLASTAARNAGAPVVLAELGVFDGPAMRARAVDQDAGRAIPLYTKPAAGPRPGTVPLALNVALDERDYAAAEAALFAGAAAFSVPTGRFTNLTDATRFKLPYIAPELA